MSDHLKENLGNTETKKFLKKFMGDVGVKCWVILNEGSEEKAVYSVENEALDFAQDLMTDANFKNFPTSRSEGLFLTYEELMDLRNKAHEEAKDL